MGHPPVLIPKSNRKGSEVASFAKGMLVGSLVASYGAMITAAAIEPVFRRVYSMIDQGMEPYTAGDFFTRAPFPVHLIIALVGGYFSRRAWQDASLYFVWVLPAGALTYRFFTWHWQSALLSPPFSARLSHFFGSDCRLPYCWDQMFFTAPFLCAAAFTIGAVVHASGLFDLGGKAAGSP